MRRLRGAREEGCAQRRGERNWGAIAAEEKEEKQGVQLEGVRVRVLVWRKENRNTIEREIERAKHEQGEKKNLNKMMTKGVRIGRAAADPREGRAGAPSRHGRSGAQGKFMFSRVRRAGGRQSAAMELSSGGERRHSSRRRRRRHACAASGNRGGEQ